jgi:cold shock CspA family protein
MQRERKTLDIFIGTIVKVRDKCGFIERRTGADLIFFDGDVIGLPFDEELVGERVTFSIHKEDGQRLRAVNVQAAE